MNPYSQQAALLLQDIETWATGLGRSLAEPFVTAQLVLILAAFLLAILLERLLGPAAEARIRKIRQQPRLLRLLALVLRRLRWMIFAILLWLILAALRAAGEPGSALPVRTAAMLVSAWVVISIASRVVKNRTLARLVAIIGWSLVALRLFGIWEPLARLLDAGGLQFGTLRISALSLLKGLLVFAVFLWLANVAGNGIERRVQRSADLTPSVQVLLGKLVKIVLITIAVLFSLSAVGLNLTALTVFSGAIGLGLGFGLQTVVSNFISGIIILLDKSIKPGDVVEVDGAVGWIRSLRARFVSVVTRDGREILVPNEDFITDKVVNWSFSDTRARLDVHFRVAFASNPHQVRDLARGAAARVGRVLADPAPVCHMTGFGDFSLEFILRFWIDDAQNGLTNVRGDVLLGLWDAFEAAGIKIPLPQREVTFKGPRDPEGREIALPD